MISLDFCEDLLNVLYQLKCIFLYNILDIIQPTKIVSSIFIMTFGDILVLCKFRYYAGIVIGCLLLLIIFLLYLGLLFGICGNPPDEYEETTCSSATGSDFLISYVNQIFG